MAQLARESDQILGSFLRGQTSVVFALAAMYAIGLSLAGLKFGMLIGIVPPAEVEALHSMPAACAPLASNSDTGRQRV